MKRQVLCSVLLRVAGSCCIFISRDIFGASGKPRRCLSFPSAVHRGSTWERRRKSEFYCILVHPALMSPPSLSAHLSPAGSANNSGPPCCGPLWAALKPKHSGHAISDSLTAMTSLRPCSQSHEKGKFGAFKILPIFPSVGRGLSHPPLTPPPHLQ